MYDELSKAFSPVGKAELCGLAALLGLVTLEQLLTLRKQTPSTTSKTTAPEGMADGRTDAQVTLLSLAGSALGP